MELTEYLQQVEDTERKQAERFWSRCVPIETAGGLVDRRVYKQWNQSMNAHALRSYSRAYMRVRRKAPHCLKTFQLIVKNGENRRESICTLAKAAR